MTKKIVVVTGGGSGMGLSTIKNMDKDYLFVISGRTVSRLENAVNELTALGYTVHPYACDVSKRESVISLVEYATSLGEVKIVINAAGVSPAMKNTPEQVLRINALGTMYVNQEFSKVMNKGSVILDVASNSAYVLPSFMAPKGVYPIAEKNEDKFIKKLVRKSSIMPKEYYKKGMAYTYSKLFVIWYAQKCAFEYGKKGIRVVSLSPGLIATDMGNMEVEFGGSLIPNTAENRMGTPDELGYAIATVADPRNGFLTAVDVLCDGGSTTRIHNRAFKKI